MFRISTQRSFGGVLSPTYSPGIFNRTGTADLVGGLVRTKRVPKPRISTGSPRWRASTIVLRMALTTVWLFFGSHSRTSVIALQIWYFWSLSLARPPTRSTESCGEPYRSPVPRHDGRGFLDHGAWLLWPSPTSSSNVGENRLRCTGHGEFPCPLGCRQSTHHWPTSIGFPWARRTRDRVDAPQV